MAKAQRFRAYNEAGDVVAEGVVTGGKATVAPQESAAVLVVIYSGKQGDEAVFGSMRVDIPAGMSVQVGAGLG